MDDEDRLAAALVVMALTRDEGAGIRDLARWRVRRLAALRQVRDEVTPARLSPGAART